MLLVRAVQVLRRPVMAMGRMRPPDFVLPQQRVMEELEMVEAVVEVGQPTGERVEHPQVEEVCKYQPMVLVLLPYYQALVAEEDIGKLLPQEEMEEVAFIL